LIRRGQKEKYGESGNKYGAALSAVWVDHPNVVLSPRLVGYAPGDICLHTAKRKNYGLVAAFAIDASIALPQSLLN
jgi:hypothetical protein